MRSLVLIGAYLLGSVPFGVLLARRAGVDLRRSGSGNIGATNVARTAGAGLGAVTVLADALKGALPVVVGHALDGDALAAAAGLLAVLGHVFPITLRGRGGKGVATAFGALLALAPRAMPWPLGVFVIVAAVTRYVSLASMLAAVTAPVAIGLLAYPRPTVAVSVAMAAIVLVRHGENMSRLLAGSEPRFGLHKKQAPPAN